MPTLVSAGSNSATATSPWASSRSSPSRSLNSTTRVVSSSATGLPMFPRRAATRAVRLEAGERLVHGAVVVVVVDEDLRPPGDVAGEPDREPVRVGRGERELPPADAEPALELVGGDDRVLGREHVGDAATHLALDGADRGLGAVPGHRARVAQAEVDVLVPVDVREVRAARGLHEQRDRALPT